MEASGERELVCYQRFYPQYLKQGQTERGPQKLSKKKDNAYSMLATNCNHGALIFQWFIRNLRQFF